MFILIILTIIILAFIQIVHFSRHILKQKSELRSKNFIISSIIGVFANFLDVLGIGSFATTTICFKSMKILKSDKLLPGTLNVGFSLPTVLEALIFVTLVFIDPLTLIALVISASIGSYIGVRLVTAASVKKIKMVTSIAMFLTALLMILKQSGVIDKLSSGNSAVKLEGIPLLIMIVGNFIFGALMPAGVGMYAPCIAMAFMLGLSPIVAFPIMMASCAVLTPIASIKFIKEEQYSPYTALGLTLGGFLGVIIAAKFVSNLDLTILTWIIIGVILYTSAALLREALWH